MENSLTVFALVNHDGRVRFNVNPRNMTNRDYHLANFIVVKDGDKYMVRKDRFAENFDRMVTLDRALELVELHVSSVHNNLYAGAL